MVDETLCKSRGGRFGRSIAYREGKSISRVSFSSKNKHAALFMMEMVQYNYLVTK
jgi:hypothetical protein